MHKYNAGALVLAETLSPQLIPHSKHYANQKHWFHGENFKIGINLVNIYILQQFGEFFTKIFPKATFEYL